MSRLPKLNADDMTASQLAVFSSIQSGPRGKVSGPFTALLHSPDLAHHVEQLGVYVRYNSQVPARQRELAICLIGADWQANYEWHAHAPLAEKAGIPAAALDQIARGETPELDDPLDRMTVTFVHELLRHRKVCDATYQDAVDAFGQSAVVDLTGLVGYYTLLAMTLNTFEVPVPDGADVPWMKGGESGG